MDTGRDRLERDGLKKNALNFEKSVTDDKGDEKSALQSPTFKIVNYKTNRGNFSSRSGYSESSENDIPSYQINQSLNGRTTSKSENENEIVLPLSPVFSPFPVSSRQYRPPSIHTLGSVAKKCYLDDFSKIKGKIKSYEVLRSDESKKKCGSVFDNLQMNDKDLSWMSFMASPTPADIPGSKFNTIERDTFLPEEKFQRIQPRALFSPTSDENSGCSPLPISSDSDEDSYRTNARLSDVCASLRELKFKSLEQDFCAPDKSENQCQEPCLFNIDTYYPSSPVFVIKPKKSMVSKKKVRVVRSPETVDGLEISHGKCTSNQSSCEKRSIGEENAGFDENIEEEELFLDVSFTELDKVCNNLLNSKKESDSNKLEINSSLSGPQHIINIFLNKKGKVSMDILQPKPPIKKEYYTNVGCANVELTKNYFSSYDEINLKNEEQNLRSKQKVNSKDFLNKLNLMLKNNPKQFYSVLMENNFDEKRIKENFEGVYWSELNKELSESQAGLSRGEACLTVEVLEEEEKMLRAVEDIEKTLAEEAEMVKAVDEMESTIKPNLTEGSCLDLYSGGNSKDDFSELDELLICKDKKIESVEQFQEAKILMPGSIQTLGPSFTNLPIFKEPSKFNDVFDDKMTNIGFSTASGLKVSISKESLERAKEFASKCEEKENFEGKNSISTVLISQTSSKLLSTGQEKTDTTKNSKHFTDNFEIKFTTCLGKTVEVTKEALKKGLEIMSDCDKNLEVPLGVNEAEPKINPSSLNISELKQSFMEAKQNLSDHAQEESLVTSSKNVIDIKSEEFKVKKGCELSEMESKASFEAQEPLEEFSYEKQISVEMTDFNCYKYDSTKDFAFSTASGQKVSVSKNALVKAKAFLSECDQDESLKNFCRSDSIRSSTPKQYHYKSREKSALKNYGYWMNNFESGFTTGLGKKVEVTKEALEKVKTLMSDCDDLKEISENAMTNIAAIEFSNSEKQRTKSKNVDFVTVHQIESETYSNFEKNDGVGGSSKRKLHSPENEAGTVIIESAYEGATSSTKVSKENDSDSSAIQVKNERLTTSEDGKFIDPVNFSDDIALRRNKKRKLFCKDEIETGKNVQKRKFSPPQKNACKSSGIKRPLQDALSPRKKIKCSQIAETVYAEEQSDSLCANEKRRQRRLYQEKIINQKQKVKPLTGSLLKKKSVKKRITFVEAVEGCLPKNSWEVNGHVNVSNAIEFKFSGQDLYGSGHFDYSTGIILEDNFELIPDEENNFGLEEFKRSFLAGPGVQPNLIPNGWIENHYKWIVWKLARYEIAFPFHFKGNALTPNNLMLQLKYRYDREIDRNERSALRKVLEKDDSSLKRMVLLIFGIRKMDIDQKTEYELNLTDGWYGCPARVDAAMARLIERGKIRAGMKLITQGAILVNCEQGISPLEMREEVHLKLFTNSTRIIRWDAKLGFQKNPGNFTVSLDSAFTDGGPISRINVIVVRIYPLIYLEKTSDGRRVVRNLKGEEKANSEHKRILEKRIEKIYNEVRSEMKSKTVEKSIESSILIDEEQGFEGETKIDSDFSALQLRHRDQIDKEISDRVEEKLKKENLISRNVSEILKVKVVDLTKPNFENPTLLSIWSPNEDVISLFCEGRSIAIMNAAVSHFSRSGFIMQINATRQTRYKKINRDCSYPKRQLTPLGEISVKSAPIFGEVDLVGIVASVKKMPSDASRPWQIIYLADEEFNFAALSFWDSCRDYGWENVLSPGNKVACSNLIWRGSLNNTVIPMLEVRETSLFTENPKTDHLKQGLEKLKKNLGKDLNGLLSECEEKLIEKSRIPKKECEIDQSREVKDSPLIPAVDLENPERAKEIKPNQSFDSGETSFASKRFEKIHNVGKCSPFRWIPYKNISNL